jgi:hypothetical protein
MSKLLAPSNSSDMVAFYACRLNVDIPFGYSLDIQGVS